MPRVESFEGVLVDSGLLLVGKLGVYVSWVGGRPLVELEFRRCCVVQLHRAAPQ
jgi:hypothetical protein